ncbi:MAG: restriction endonuclease subunit S, partial [Pseudomonadota bacterium]|nr:restriction endonuclease subunit S [Pseudomonadota bacterium]
KIGLILKKSTSNQQINAILPNEKIESKFLAYSLVVKIEQMKVVSNASTIGIMNQEKTKQIFLVVPTKVEQTAIVEFLDQQTAKIDELISHAHQGIDLLKERRSALISAAVTGKIDVRSWQPPATAATTPQGQQQILFDD